MNIEILVQANESYIDVSVYGIIVQRCLSRSDAIEMIQTILLAGSIVDIADLIGEEDLSSCN